MDNYQDEVITEFRLRSNDFDHNKHLNNSVFLQAFEFGRWDWAQKNQIELDIDQFAIVVAQIRVDFLKPVPLMLNGAICVRTKLTATKFYKVEMFQTIESDSGIAYAKADLILGVVDSQSRLQPAAKIFRPNHALTNL